jgi:hypothetical protein
MDTDDQAVRVAKVNSSEHVPGRAWPPYGGHDRVLTVLLRASDIDRNEADLRLRIVLAGVCGRPRTFPWA